MGCHLTPIRKEEYTGKWDRRIETWRQSQNKLKTHSPTYIRKLEGKKHLRNCGTGNFTIIPFLQLRTNEADLRREYENYFTKKFKKKLMNL